MPSPEVLLQGAVVGVVLASVYILTALGLAIIFSVLKVINFAHGDFVMLGAVVTYYVYVAAALPFYIAVAAALGGGVMLGALLERGIFRKFHGELMPGFVISLGLAWVIQMSTQLVYGAHPRGVPRVFDHVVLFAGVAISSDRIMIVVVGVIMLALAYVWATRSQTGRALRAVAINRSAASLVGINTKRLTMLGFAGGAALATTAGALIAPILSVRADMGLLFSIKAFLIVIIGGMGSIPGAIVAGGLVGMFEGIAGLFVSGVAVTMIEFPLVVLLLVVRPQGLFGAEDV